MFLVIIQIIIAFYNSKTKTFDDALWQVSVGRINNVDGHRTNKGSTPRAKSKIRHCFFSAVYFWNMIKILYIDTGVPTFVNKRNWKYLICKNISRIKCICKQKHLIKLESENYYIHFPHSLKYLFLLKS